MEHRIKKMEGRGWINENISYEIVMPASDTSI